MNILHVVHGYPPSMGGTQWLVKSISERLVAHHSDRVTVYTTTAYDMELFWRPGERAMPPGTEQANGVQVRRFPVFNRLGPLLMLAAHGSHRLRLPYNDWLRTVYNGPIVSGLSKAVASSKADIIMASAFPHLHMYCALAGAKRAAIPIVFLGAIHAADTWGYDRRMMDKAVGQADAYIALTLFERDYLVERGIQKGKISVIGAGVDPDPFLHADGSTIRQHYGWQQRPVVGIVAKQTPRKRIDVLIRAMQQVWSIQPDVQLLIAGARTAYSQHIHEIISRLPTEHQARITVVDTFPEETKPALLAACDLFVLPSGHESFGIAFLEAWACGKPVIGVRSGAIPSVIADGQDGLLVPYEDVEQLAESILELLTDPQRRLQMGEAGRCQVLSHYTWDIITERIRSLYANIIAQHSAVPKRRTVKE